TNTTTTTGYYTSASNSTGYNGSLSNPAAGTVDMSTGVVTWTNGFSGTVTLRVTANGCNGPSAQVTRTVTISPATVGGSIAGSTTVCYGTNTGTLTLSGYTGSIVGWESSIDNGVTWSSISNTTNTYTYNNIAQKTLYRALVQSGGCSSAYSALATLNVTPVLTATIAGTASVCQNAASPTITFTGADGTAPYTFTYKINTGANQIITTSTGSSVTILAPTNAAGTFTYTLVSISSGTCTQAKSGSATITVTAQTAAGSVAGSTTVCPGNNSGTLTLSGNTGSVTRWEYNNGATWTTIANTGTSITYTNLTEATQYRAVVQNGSCAAVNSATATISIYTYGRWTGDIDTLWNVAGNWQCGMIPTLATNVIIPAGRTNYPVIKSTIVGMSNNLNIETGATITIRSGLLQIAGTVTATGANIRATEGKVEFIGTAFQTIPDNLFYLKTIKDLVITNAADVTLAGALRVTNSVGFGSVDNSLFFSNGYLTLVSNAIGTANVHDVTNGGVNTGNSINGDVTVERYIPPKRAYRYLTAPVNASTSIRANWMEGVYNATNATFLNPNPGYGTNITGPNPAVNHFDPTTTNNPSVYVYNDSSQVFTSLSNTDNLVKAGAAFRIMVRGDRSVDMRLNAPTPTPTVLRAKGNLVIGKVTMAKKGGGGTPGMPVLGVAGMPVSGTTPIIYNFIGNPYASVIDWLKVSTTNISSTIYIYDPLISGSNGRGAYVSYNNVQKRNSNISSQAGNYIQSGQAIFVVTQGANPTIVFDETAKTDTLRALFKTDRAPNVAVQLLLPGQITEGGSADEASIFFSEDYNASIGDEDSYKLTNLDENIAIVREGQALSLEGRKPVRANDTIPLKIWQLTQTDYALKISVNNFPPNVEGYLEDKFLNTRTALLHDDENIITFKKTGDPLSAAADRFRVVFKTASTLPLHLLGITATEKNSGVEVKWVAETESEMDRYEVEKSANATTFITVATVKAKVNPGPSTTYTWPDITPFDGDSYYRIKAIDKSGEVKYSAVAKVSTAKAKSNITVFPNPVTGLSITANFKNIAKGNYNISIINSFGQKVYDGIISHGGGTSSHAINFTEKLPAGVYQLQIAMGEVNEEISLLVK
ncbi:MAG TPA: T9SS type A sorting domain-containing protein, partial [Segetibacter sp.]